ncbi:MAG TPA: mismatch-specific DNA-glycosylase [Nocardioides sp.]
MAPPRRTFTRAELESHRGEEVPDLLPGAGDPPLRLLFVGINPGLWTAATQTHFAHPTNRFYPALHAAGIVERAIDPAEGMTDDDRAHLRSRGIGITNVVRRATARADELTTLEYREGGQRLRDRVEELEPRVVAVAGLTAYRTAFKQPRAAAGLQADPWGGTEVWVVPNPSGLNAHDTVESLAAAYGAAARAAGVLRG